MSDLLRLAQQLLSLAGADSLTVAGGGVSVTVVRTGPALPLPLPAPPPAAAAAQPAGGLPPVVRSAIIPPTPGPAFRPGMSRAERTAAISEWLRDGGTLSNGSRHILAQTTDDPQTGRQLADKAGMRHDQNFDRHLQELCGEGWLEKREDGYVLGARRVPPSAEADAGPPAG